MGVIESNTSACECGHEPGRTTSGPNIGPVPGHWGVAHPIGAYDLRRLACPVRRGKGFDRFQDPLALSHSSHEVAEYDGFARQHAPNDLFDTGRPRQ